MCRNIKTFYPLIINIWHIELRDLLIVPIALINYEFFYSCRFIKIVMYFKWALFLPTWKLFFKRLNLFLLRKIHCVILEYFLNHKFMNIMRAPNLYFCEILPISYNLWGTDTNYYTTLFLNNYTKKNKYL